MNYRVGTFRAVGLKAKWTRTRSGAPIIACQREDSEQWFVVDAPMFKTMEEIGILEGWERHTALGHIFSINA